MNICETIFYPKKKTVMKYGARNAIKAKVKSIKKDEIMAQVKFEEIDAHEMASVLTAESVEEMDLKAGDAVRPIIKAIHVLPFKE